MSNENNSLIPETFKEIKPEILTEEVDDKHTLFLDSVPSDVVYRMVTKSLEEGEILSKEEVMARMEEPIRVSYNEFYSNLLAMIKEQESKTDEFYHTEKPTPFFDKDLISGLGNKNYPITAEEHRPSLWHINPNNPDEEIQECLDCGAVINRRAKHTHQYAGTSKTNEELLAMIKEQESKTDEFYHTEKPTPFFDKDLISSLGNQNYPITAEEHRPSLWHINPNNPDEEIQECLDCGAIIDRRAKHTHQYVGTSNTNEELLRMLNSEDTSVRIEENTHNYTPEPEEPGFKL